MDYRFTSRSRRQISSGVHQMIPEDFLSHDPDVCPHRNHSVNANLICRPAETRNSERVRPLVSAFFCSLSFTSDVHLKEILASLAFTEPPPLSGKNFPNGNSPLRRSWILTLFHSSWYSLIRSIQIPVTYNSSNLRSREKY